MLKGIVGQSTIECTVLSFDSSKKRGGGLGWKDTGNKGLAMQARGLVFDPPEPTSLKGEQGDMSL